MIEILTCPSVAQAVLYYNEKQKRREIFFTHCKLVTLLFVVAFCCSCSIVVAVVVVDVAVAIVLVCFVVAVVAVDGR